ncbi:MAG TPA: SPOR domain-containing protein [Anaeromyxobacteraceae bacterium]|nr:SPOR domain-containing protein [Anaeromyxobacteraceae bacterium]
MSPQRYELSLTAKQACGVLVVALAVGGGAFYLGASVGRRSAEGAAAAPAARDPLARLDEPLGHGDEAPPELKAHQALVDSRSIDKSMPVFTVKAPAAPVPPASDEDKAGDENLTPPTVASAPGPLLVPTPPAAAAVAAPQAPARPATAARSPVAPSAHYTIQVGSAPRRADAERLAKKLAARKAKVVVADVPGKGRWYRVQVGTYKTPEAARLQLASLEKSGVHGIVAAVR